MTTQWTGLVSAVLFFVLAGGEVLGCDVNTEYQCANSKCIPLSSFNNSYNDCGDNSDEVAFPCRAPMFSCLNGRCVLMAMVRDGKDDCLDQSDEVKMIGQRCSVADTCCFCHEYVTRSECVDGVCRCQDGYYSNDIGNECLPRLIGSPCNATSQCRVVELFSYCDCEDHICVCDEERHPTDDRRRCVLPAADNGDSQ